MDPFQGIITKISSNGNVLVLYDDPDPSETQESRERHHYVEVVAGSTFQVKISLTPQYNFHNMKSKDAVVVRVMVDGDSNTRQRHDQTKKALQKKFSQGQLGDYAFTGFSHFCNETKQWIRGNYSFANLVLKDSPGSGLSEKQAQKIGVIKVFVQRVTLTGRRSKASQSRVVKMNEVSEEALKGRPVEIMVRCSDNRPTSAPFLAKKLRPIDGEAGEPVVFNIHYRSRRALQMIGCIPRSPSSAIEISDNNANEPTESENGSFLSNSSTNDQGRSLATTSAGSPDEMLRHIQTLTARITELERRNVKAETTDPGTAIKGEAAGVKRKRDEGDGTEGTRQKRRTRAKVEHIDLTDD